MRIITKPVCYCDFCGKHGLSKSAMKKHELMCFNNPANERPCFSCEYLLKKEASITCYNYDGSEAIRNVQDFYCEAKEIFLYTPKNEIKGNQHDLDEGNKPMPKMCDIYENSQEFFNDFLKDL
jgi:hypothetical protein